MTVSVNLWIGGEVLSLPFRWTIVVILALLAFVACWTGLYWGAGLDSGQALGWSVVPFSIALALGGSWAERARTKREHHTQQPSSTKGPGKKIRIVQKQRAKNNSQQLQAGRDMRIDEK